MGKEKRLKYTDIAKGLGIIAVLCAHAGVGIIWIQPYYMPMFFTVSGCIFTFLHKNTNYCLMSAIKMVKLYFKYSIIVAVMYIPLLFIKQNDGCFIARNMFGVFYARKAFYSPLGIENNIVFMEIGNGPMWFLNCLAVAWVLFIPLVQCKKKTILAIVIILYLLLGDFLSKLPIMLPWSIDTAFVAALFIFVGTKFENVRERYLTDRVDAWGYKTKYIIIAYGLCQIVYIILIKRISIGWNMSVGAYDTSIMSFCMFCMLGTIMLLLFCCLLEKIPAVVIIASIGRNSLSILCFHAVIYQYIDVVNSKFNFSQYSWYNALKIFVAMTISLSLGKTIRIVKNRFAGD